MMHDMENIIEAFDEAKELVWRDDDEYTIGYNNGLEAGKNIALSLMEKQKAKPVVRKQCKKEHEDGSIDYFAEWYCPHCSLLILRGFDNPSIKFCYKCGNPILWEGR